MANTTVGGAKSIHGTNPQYLIEKVIRARIYDSPYWKEHCFALNSASLIDNAIGLEYIGGTYANQKPTEFMCLVLKLLQLQPEREIILEYLRAEEFKYLRALAAFYVRLTFDALNAYEVLEPLLEDYRKIRTRAMDGSYSLTTMDAFADALLHDERVCEIQLPRLTQRKVLEETEGLAARRSKLGRAMNVLGEADEDEEEEIEGRGRYLSRSPSGSRSPSPEPDADAKTPEYWTEGSEDESEEEGPATKAAKVIKETQGSQDGSEGGRYISRSPSPNRSDRFVSRSPSPGSPKGSAMDVDGP
ncbi:hypothetical protein RQP46_004097 [Phenoliferia psychrophenolica]